MFCARRWRVMLTKWLRFRGLFRIYIYVFLMFCSMTVFVLSTIFSEIENYQVRLAEEIKAEIDLSVYAPRHTSSLTGATKKLLFSSTTKKLEREYWSLSEEEARNALLFQLKNQSSRGNVSQENATTQQPSCIGKSAPQEFVFHKIAQGVTYIYSAFWDSRWNDFDNKDNSTYIRLFGVAEHDGGGGKRPPLSCLFYIKGAYHIIPTQEYQMTEDHRRTYRGYIFSCKVPVAVKSVVCSVLVASGETADPAWATRIPVLDIQPQEERYNIIQCVPPVFGDIQEQKFLEFMEMSKLLGSEHVVIYSLNPNKLTRALEYYKQTGFATVVPWPLPPKMTKLWSKGQIIAIQDCLYRGMATSDLIVFNDVDEHIIPRAHKTWTALINAIDRSNEHIGYVFHSTFFERLQEQTSEQIPDVMKPFESLTIVTDTKRTNMTSPLRNKLIVRPSEIFEKGIHHISKPVDAQMAAVEVKEETALLHHYRKCDTQFSQKCKAWRTDQRAWGYARELHERVLFARKWISKLLS